MTKETQTNPRQTQKRQTNNCERHERQNNKKIANPKPTELKTRKQNTGTTNLTQNTKT